MMNEKKKVCLGFQWQEVGHLRRVYIGGKHFRLGRLESLFSGVTPVAFVLLFDGSQGYKCQRGSKLDRVGYYL